MADKLPGYDYELTLIGAVGYQKNADDQQVPTEQTRTTVLCRMKSASLNEFYSAAQANLRAEYVFIVHRFEYNNEDELEFDGKRYSVTRPWMLNAEEMALTCERKMADVD